MLGNAGIEECAEGVANGEGEKGVGAPLFGRFAVQVLAGEPPQHDLHPSIDESGEGNINGNAQAFIHFIWILDFNRNYLNIQWKVNTKRFG
jgi:hypothetical protein